jgi:hypothetical protein
VVGRWEIRSHSIGFLQKLHFCVENKFSQKIEQTFLQCLQQLPHGEIGSYPCYWQNQIHAEFFAIYRENHVFLATPCKNWIPRKTFPKIGVFHENWRFAKISVIAKIGVFCEKYL